MWFAPNYNNLRTIRLVGCFTEYKDTLINLANYPLIMFAMAKIMEMNSKEQIIANLMQGSEFMEENKLSIQKEISNEEIKSLIYTIRGKQVMLDSDVAMLYHYSTKRINETVNRNKQRFPENFCFKLTNEEYDVLRFKDITLNKDSIQENFENSLRS